MILIRRLLILAILMIAFYNSTKAYQPCDTVRTCVGKTLKFTVTQGRGAQYIDILNTNLMQKVNQNMTLEMWLKPEKQLGKLQYIGGMWGPATEKYDSWVVYISADDSLIFHINGQNETPGNLDDTRLSIPFSNYYDNWNHFAFVADGSTGWIYIYVNSFPVDSARNTQYPYYAFKQINNPDLSWQLGSTNALSNDLNLHRTYKGYMDEIRIWGKVLNQNDLVCYKDKSLAGTEKDLYAYYRCNDSSYIYKLCDATPNGNSGFLRAGLSTVTSDRKDYGKVVVMPTAITDTVYCETEKIYEFTVVDTALCPTTTQLLDYDGYLAKNSIFYFLNGTKEETLLSWRYTPLQPGQPVTIRVKAKLDFIGTIKTRLIFRNNNSCGNYHLNVPVSITRKSELSMSSLQMKFDSLKARCLEKPFIDSTLKICNTSNKSVTINSINLKMPEVFQLTYPTLPKVLLPNECLDVKIRFRSRDTTMAYFDTLRILSTDKCAGDVKIPIYGKVNEVLVIWRRGSEERLDSFNFGQSCVDMPDESVEYEWMNKSKKNITIESITIPPNFFGKSFKFPIILEPETGYNPSYFRFFPKQKGVFNDSIVIIAKSENCTIHYPIYITARGYEADIKFVVDTVDFGTVIVGQESTLNVDIKNGSDQSLTASLYLRKGEPFYLSGTKNLSIASNATKPFPLTFRPTTSGTFLDEVCLYENSCLQSYCIYVKGKAIVQRVQFLPEILELNNVVSCQSKEGSLEIENITSSPQTYSNFILTQASNKFTLISPSTLPKSITLEPNHRAQFSFRYTPADNTTDRADRAYLEFQTEDGEMWSAKIYGTSITPKLYLTSEIAYETIEVGGVLYDTLHLENISNYDITINNYTISPGFELIYPTDFNNVKLKPKDTIQVIIAFKPTESKEYKGYFTVNSEAPCPISSSSYLTGNGIIVPLDVPLKVITYGFVLPCDCQVRSIPLINNSFYFDMDIDSVWIDSINVTNPKPEFYTWYSHYSPDGVVPYKIPPRSTDTLYIKFCPRNEMDAAIIDNDARLFLKAKGSGWENTYTSYLAGKQTLVYEYDAKRIIFPPTRVDTVSTPQFIHLRIPALEFNPQQAKVTITDITFEPNERVFYAYDSLGSSFPLYVDTNNILTLRLEFKPRAVRYYENKLKITISDPCNFIDTTVILSGSGFAPAYGLSFTFNNTSALDTFRIVPCDTLAIPIYTSRAIPADIVDIDCRIGYDTTKLEYLYSESDYLNENCKSYVPFLNHKYSEFGGSEFLLKNACYVDSIRPIFTAYFKPRISNRDSLIITLDSIHFDTEEIIMYHIIAENDFARVIIQKPELTAVSSADFDSVKVLDCVERTVFLHNTGDVPLSLFSLLNLNNELFYVSSVPNLTDTLMVGDTISVILKFCPRKSAIFNQFIQTIAASPCQVLDSNLLTGIGYAPRYEIGFDTQNSFSIPDSLITQLGDTITIPIYLDKDINTTLQGQTIWLEDLSFSMNLYYNTFALEMLDVRNFVDAKFTNTYTPGNISIKFDNSKQLAKGKLFEIDFLSTIPDTNFSKIQLMIDEFSTDSVMFLDLVPLSDSTYLISKGKCGLTTLQYTGVMPSLGQNNPNPWNYETEIKFSISEKTNATLEIYSISGELVKSIFNDKPFKIGNYSIKLVNEGLPTGMYYYILRTNHINQTKSMIIVE